MLPATIHVIDDDPSVRSALGSLLRSLGYEVRLYESAVHFSETKVDPARGCILLDVEMPGLRGPDLQARLNASESLLPIIFLTGHADLPSGVRAVKAGAEDFLAKPATKEVLTGAIERALRRYDVAYAEKSRVRAIEDKLSRLTPREREVLDLVVAGKLNKQIAYELGASERTIKAHRHNVMQKLQVGSVAELVLLVHSVSRAQGQTSPVQVGRPQSLGPRPRPPSATNRADE